MWVRLDDRFHSHPKIVGLSDAAYRLHVGALCYVAQHLTGGYVPPGYVPRPLRPIVAELVDAILWEDSGKGGWFVHDWEQHNLSAKRERERQEAAAERMRRLRQQRRDGMTVRRNDDNP